MVASVMNQQNNDKHISKLSQIIIKWGGLLGFLFSYGLILGLAVAGLGLMALCAVAGLFNGNDLHSGFGFLTGGVIFTAGCSMVLMKMSQDLEALRQYLKK